MYKVFNKRYLMEITTAVAKLLDMYKQKYEHAKLLGIQINF